MSLSSLKKNRNKLFEKLEQDLKAENTPQQSSDPYNDDRYWKPEVDKSGNGSAIIRFLPPPEGEDMPYVKVWSHGFKGPNGWYIENSLTTIGQKDPVSEYNSILWNNGTDAGKEQARDQKRRLSYYSNIYVVKDDANPSNEGKVFLFRYGKKIFDKIQDVMQPEFEDDERFNPFDFWEGADFRLRIRTVDGYRNYDKSLFDSSSEFLDSDEDELEKVWKQEYSLSELIDDKNFKSYDELKQKLNRALGLDDASIPASTFAEAPKPQPAKQTKTIEEDIPFDNPTPISKDTSVSDDDDDGLSYFEKLAQES